MSSATMSRGVAGEGAAGSAELVVECDAGGLRTAVVRGPFTAGLRRGQALGKAIEFLNRDTRTDP